MALRRNCAVELRILHIEDEPLDTDMVRRWLTREGLDAQLDRVQTMAELRAALERGGYTLILADYTLPGMDPWEVLRLARERRPEVPFIVFSGTLGEDTAIETLKQGANDFVLKQRPARLVPVVRRALREAEEHARHRQAEQASQFLAALVSSSEDAILSKTLDGIIASWNRGAERLFGYSAREAIGQPISIIIPPDRLGEETAILERVRRGEGVEHFETVRRRKDASLVPVSLAVSPVRDRDGNIIAASKIARDMTGNKQAEQALRQSEEKFRAVFEQAAIGIGRVGFHDARWIDVNEAFCRMLGYTPQEMRATPWPQITHPEDVDLDLVPFRRMAAGELDSYTVEKRFLHKEGRLVWARLTLSLVRDLQGRPDYEIAVIENITERKQAQEQLRRANEDLERKVQERTAELRAAMAEMEQMSYSMVHDMRAPLRAIQGFGGILQEEARDRLSHEDLELVSKMRRAAGRLDHLIVDVLNYSKVVRRELPLQPVPVGPLVRGILETYPDLQGPQAQVRVAADLPVVVGNPGALTQCLAQLLRNAVKFAKPGQQARIELCSELGPDGWVRIVVQDNGIGIAPELQAKVFGMFQRLSNDGEGTGMGLAIVKKAVERMGGHVGLESQLGQGSRFWLELPDAQARLQNTA